MKYFILTLMFFITFIGSSTQAYDGSTKASVTMAGGIIKAQHTENTKKYKRKNCPVCKGKGYYISGDKISKVDCGYCEPETSSEVIVEHPPVIISGPDNQQPKCNGPQCNGRLSILKR